MIVGLSGIPLSRAVKDLPSPLPATEAFQLQLTESSIAQSGNDTRKNMSAIAKKNWSMIISSLTEFL
jgi:hypothetical protein